MAAPVETTNVVIAEPSDQNEELLPSERPCFTKKHLYIAIGVVFVVAISLIGSLLDFTPAADQVTEESIREGTLETFPEFDTNGDGFIDRAEFTQWSAERIAARQRWNSRDDPEPEPTTSLPSGGDATTYSCGNATSCTPPPTTVDEHFSPVDLNKDGRVTRDEAVAFALRILEGILRMIRGHNVDNNRALEYSPPAVTMKPQCEAPTLPGFPGRRRKGWVGACQPGYQLWCFTSPFCRHKRKCHKYVINVEWQTTDTCCGSSGAANCTDCTCGGSYSFVPEGRQARVRNFCHWLSTYHCGEINTGVSVR